MGEERQNPFSISILNQAYSLAHNGETRNYPITHLYVKFTPQVDTQYLDLIESGLELFDFPLTKQIIEYNDYYYEWTDSSQMPELYGVITPGQSLPAVNYEVLEYMNLEVDDTMVMHIAAILTDNGNDLPSIVPRLDTENEEGGGGGGNNEDPDPNSACGCGTTHTRNPAGCVRVWDTEFQAFVPVKFVKVTVKDNWFLSRSTYSNINGCWSIDKKHYGKVWVHYTFENEHIKIRSVHNSTKSIAMLWKSTVKHHLPKINGPVYNNINTLYSMWNVNGSIAHVFWSSATTINSEQEMRGFATQDYIQYASRQLDFFIAHLDQGNQGFSLLRHYLGIPLTTAAILGGLTTSNTFTTTASITLGLMFPPSLVTASSVSAIAVAFFAPDVMVTDNFTSSDEFKQLTFHELGHALHAISVGKLWWRELVSTEIRRNGDNGLPYGDGNFNHADKVALTESWAEFIGTLYVAKHYISIPALTISWNERNEDLEINSNYIPEGIHFDLFDLRRNGNYTDEPIINGINVVDEVTGYSINSIFNALGYFPNGVTSFTIFRTNLNNNLGSNNSQQLLDLFNAYGR